MHNSMPYSPPPVVRYNEDDWYTARYVESKNPRFLVIGSGEVPPSSILASLNKPQLIIIDDFDDLPTESERRRYDAQNGNLQSTARDHRVLKERSTEALMKINEVERLSEDPGFDWIYKRGSKDDENTVIDCELAWRIARRGAIFVFHVRVPNGSPNGRPQVNSKRNIDVFMDIHQKEFEILPSPLPNQIVLKKKTDISIGNPNSQPPKDPRCRCDDGICIAFAMDSDYSMPGAVAIKGILQHTPGRIYIFILDLGMSDRDQQRIRGLPSMPSFNDVTFVFVPLPPDSISIKPGMGKSWAKIDLLSSLLKKRLDKVLFLDADVLIRKSLLELWNEQFENSIIAAVPSVRHPNRQIGPSLDGSHSTANPGYFNDGVILANMNRLRDNWHSIYQLIEGMGSSRYKEQDVLNTFFRGNWKRLSMKWNAQGLGTFASSDLVDGSRLYMPDERDDPCIVHFTGPVNPTFCEVVDQIWQPYTSKPWGYAGSPGHPFAVEWWRVLEATPWSEWIRSSERYDSYESARKTAVDDALRDFQRKVGRCDLWFQWRPSRCRRRFC